MDIGTLSASIASSVVSRIVCYPLDTIAIQHTSSTRRPIFSVPLRSYYRGVGVSVCIVTPAMALYLCTYRQSKESLLPYLGDTTANYVASGTAAELASSLLWTPLEVIKARMQISATEQEGKLMYNLRHIARNEGIKGFYRGYAMGLGIFVPYNAIYWSVYENVKKSQALGQYSLPTQAALSSMAGVAASASLIHPLDLIKTRYQVATSGTVDAVAHTAAGAVRASDQKGIAQIVTNVLAESGKKGFYKGFIPRLCCSLPSSLIVMSVFEYLKPDESAKISEKSLETEFIV
jgi:solute carrier family 25 iron transporter 28/37